MPDIESVLGVPVDRSNMTNGPETVESPIDQLIRLATRVDSNAAAATRPGQTTDLESIATEIRAVADRLKSYEGITALLDDRASTERKLRKELAETTKMLDKARSALDHWDYD